MTPEYVVCADTGSTFTKAAAVAVSGPDVGRLLAASAVATTVGPGLDVLTGLDEAVARVVAESGGGPGEIRVCSSAGGGLRLAVVGYERVVTAEAGARVPYVVAGSPLEVPNDLVRLSVGIENGVDLVADLRQALDAAAASTAR